MIINYLALAIAIILSVVAAYYSIVGLAMIFASAMIPVIIMASALEAGKVVSASWLYRNWGTAPRFIKYYLTVAVVVLMFITSMGIFGFLSKAHLDQSVISGDSVTKLAVYDERIRTSKDNIEVSRKALKQMDDAVDQVMGRSSDEKGADKAVAIRRGQQKERQRIQSEIQAEQKTISELNNERAPIAAEVRKVEAEVGPIKYIAALMYGDNPDQNILEKAVRSVIIILVLVFDPLAIMLLLAANHSIYRKEEPKAEQPPVVEEPIVQEPVVATPVDEVIPEAVVETPLPPEDPPPPPPPRETWSPRWYQKARGLIDKKKQGIIEINKDSIVDMK
jgi:hypothetical protein